MKENPSKHDAIAFQLIAVYRGYLGKPFTL